MKEKIHRYIYILGLCIIAFFISISEFITNATIIMLALNYLLEFGYQEKFKRLINTKTLMWFLLIFFVHVIWLFFSTNIDYALNDLKIKLPLLALPIIIATSKQLSKVRINQIIFIFIIGVFVCTLIGFLSYLGFLYKIDKSNIRHVSIFVSHIRLSLMICLCVFIIIHKLFSGYFRTLSSKIVFCCLTAWLIFFLFFIQAFTGIVILCIVGLILISYYSYKEKNKKRKVIYLTTLSSFLIIITLFLGLNIISFYTPCSGNQELLTYTKQGNKYEHEPDLKMIENGNLIYINICEKEVREEWKNKSNKGITNDCENKDTVPYDAIIRYLSSKGLNKDAEGILALSDIDITNLENGYTNYKYTQNNSFRKRVYEIIWQLDVYYKTNNPNEKSVSQRIEYQKIGLILFKNHFWLGTSNGDLNDEYQVLYEELNSPLSTKYRHRAHNQLLTFFISFGVIGGIACLLGWIMPFIIEMRTSRRFNFIVFFLIASISLFSDDTFETNTGAVFVAYFFSLFMWGGPNSKNPSIKETHNE